MAWCNFCKKLKVRSTDFIFMIIMCVILYFVYKWQFASIQEEQAQKKAQKEAAQQKQKAQEQYLEQIRQMLDSMCQNGDKQACQQLQKHQEAKSKEIQPKK